MKNWKVSASVKKSDLPYGYSISDSFNATSPFEAKDKFIKKHGKNFEENSFIIKNINGEAIKK